jgi:hypothetical protein
MTIGLVPNSARKAPPQVETGPYLVFSAPDRIRTCDLWLRRPTLYPSELRARTGGRRNKPSSVPLARGRSFLWERRCRCPRAAYPGLKTERAAPRPLFGLAPGGVCRATSVTGGAVRSYRTLSPLPDPRRAGAIGGLLSVALSVALRRPGVTRHPALWSSDFPRHPEVPRSSLASPFPTDERTTMPRRGLEPPRRFRHQILSLACLPVPASGLPPTGTRQDPRSGGS